eukprot:jgi/Galph1/5274/GphlegSOOS_G3981.1
MRRCLCVLSSSIPNYREYLFVGLGNPGPSYYRTRHNIGSEVLDYYAKRHGFAFSMDKYLQAEYACWKWKETKVHLLKPMTFMNNSGQSIGAFLRRCSLPISSILVIVDDLSLPFGRTRLRLKGSDGGHNGLKSIQKTLHSTNFARLRVGIDEPKRNTQPVESYVLCKFSASEQRQLESIFMKCAEVLDLWLEETNVQRVLTVANSST